MKKFKKIGLLLCLTAGFVGCGKATKEEKEPLVDAFLVCDSLDLVSNETQKVGFTREGETEISKFLVINNSTNKFEQTYIPIVVDNQQFVFDSFKRIELPNAILFYQDQKQGFIATGAFAGLTQYQSVEIIVDKFTHAGVLKAVSFKGFEALIESDNRGNSKLDEESEEGATLYNCQETL